MAAPFAFNFFGGGGGGSNDSNSNSADEARALAEAEAAADALLAAPLEAGPWAAAAAAAAGGAAAATGDGSAAAGDGGGGGGGGGLAYDEPAAEVIPAPRPAAACDGGSDGGAAAAAAAAAAVSEVELPGTDIRLLKVTVSGAAAAELLGDGRAAGSDLVPGHYEGGFKLWEGGVDLAAYLAREYGLTAAGLFAPTPPDTPLKSLRVLELGCGHALPGIVCLLAGASAVALQDYNAEVLTAAAAPNAAANLARLPGGGAAARAAARYFKGDWLAFGDLLAEKSLSADFDLVLAAEAIYSPPASRRLLECVKRALRPPRGIALIAAKSHYFGVGGGTAAFEALVAADGALKCERVWVLADGSGNKREVLRLTFKAAADIEPYFH